MDLGKTMSRMVQVGYVTAVNLPKRMVRVRFPDTEITSGWLYVLQHSGTEMTITKDGGHSHSITVSDSYTGGGSASVGAVPDHDHKNSKTTVWMPKVNDRVVVLYLPVADGDGFILGGI